MNEDNYRPPTADVTPEAAGTSEEQDLSAFIGPGNNDYYMARFRRIEEGRGGGWHWPAFFITSGWLLYRKMWLAALAYLVGLPILASVFSGVVSAAINETLGGLIYIAYVISLFLVVPFFANKLYYARAKSKIATVNGSGLDEASRRQAIERKGGTSLIAAILILLIPLAGIMAAITIPAYQDYTIRAQVSEGLFLAAPAKASISQYYADQNAFPMSNAEAGLPESVSISGEYVTSVSVNGGRIDITYGNNANGNIDGSTLTLVPEVGNEILQWTCGGDIADVWLPAACR